MKKRLIGTFAAIVVIVAVVVAWPPHGIRKINYVGKTREQVVLESGNHKRYLDGKIMILVDSTYKYYSSIEDIRRDSDVMRANEWGINFREGIIRTHYFVLTFEQDVVISQRKSWYGDI